MKKSNIPNENPVLAILSQAPNSVVAKFIEKTIDSFGYYQVLLILLLCWNDTISAISDGIPSFYTYTPEYHCVDNSIKVSIHCTVYYNITDAIFKDYKNSTCSSECSEYEFLDTDTSIVTEFSLICDRRYLAALSTTIYFVGIMVGSVICGVLADIWGRKLVILVCLGLQFVFGIAVHFSSSLTVFITLRFFQGLFIQVSSWFIQKKKEMLILKLPRVFKIHPLRCFKNCHRQDCYRSQVSSSRPDSLSV